MIRFQRKKYRNINKSSMSSKITNYVLKHAIKHVTGVNLINNSRMLINRSVFKKQDIKIHQIMVKHIKIDLKNRLKRTKRLTNILKTY